MKVEIRSNRKRVFGLEKKLRDLLEQVPPEHLVGLSKIVIWDSFPSAKVRGRYTHESGSQARIDLFFDEIFGNRASWLYLSIPFLSTYILAKVLFHEIGHHYQRFTHNVKRRSAEKAADAYSLRMTRAYLCCAVSRGWLRVFRSLLPVFRLAFLVTNIRYIRRLRGNIQRDPHDVVATNSLAEIYYRARFFSKAQKLWSRVLSVDNANSAANAGLASVLWRRGDSEQALRLWKLALAGDPTNSRIRESLRKATQDVNRVGGELENPPEIGRL